MTARAQSVQEKELPFLVAEVAEQIAGYAYASPYRPRAGYRFTLEDSVYVAPDAVSAGVGSALLAELITRCTDLGYRQMIAIIGDTANHASIRLHAKHGFVDAGTIEAVGFKFGRWVDLVWMQRPLNGGGASPPDAPGLSLSGV